ncbi:MAG TPA: helix-turn-helix transcriptional regulator [Polyangiaceae bacterium]|jgi:DNA-binding NarL/FixJ family response regulator|nr:helix-turn-helix transcriptional regulator [Polyangiaceae bacterium]
MHVGREELAVFSLPVPPPDLPASISEAEREVALALLQGLSNAQIAAARRTSTRTVANQVSAILRKLGARSRADVTAILTRGQRGVCPRRSGA